MSTTPAAAAAFAAANDTFRMVVAGLRMNGKRSAYWQLFDDGLPGTPVDIAEEPLDEAAARAVIVARFATGFQGVGIFAALVGSQATARLVVEAHDSRTGGSVRLTGKVARTLTGKYKLAGQPELHGDAAPL